MKVAVLGASGYTGAEAVRLLAQHPRTTIPVATAESHAGERISSVFPHLERAFTSHSDGAILTAVERSGLLDGSISVDAVVACLPPGTTQSVLSELPSSLPIVDLSADFRLRSPAVYEQWYGGEHRAPDLQSSERVCYGLTEFARPSLSANVPKLVANPGCYPTCAQLPLRPLIERGIVNASQGVIVDAISGASGAGRAPRQNTLLCEAGESAKQYGLPAHRHQPEIEQGLTDSNAGTEVPVDFTPHLGAFSRGMVATIHAQLVDGHSEHDAQAALEQAYADEPFIRVLPFATPADSNHVRGSNDAVLCACPSRFDGQVRLVCAIDNLLKGATGQAVQNLNVMLGLDELEGLDYLPTFP